MPKITYELQLSERTRKVYGKLLNYVEQHYAIKALKDHTLLTPDPEILITDKGFQSAGGLAEATPEGIRIKLSDEPPTLMINGIGGLFAHEYCHLFVGRHFKKLGSQQWRRIMDTAVHGTIKENKFYPVRYLSPSAFFVCRCIPKIAYPDINYAINNYANFIDRDDLVTEYA